MSTPTPAALPEVQIDDLDGTRLKFWHAEQGAVKKTLGDLEARFNATNPWGIWVEESGLSSMLALEDQLLASSGTASAPDVVIAYPEHALAWNQTGDVLIDLQRYIQDPAWGLSLEELEDRQPVVWSAAQVGPAWLGIPATSSTQVLFYNQTWGQELGFEEPPRRLEEFRAIACAAADANMLDPHWVKHGTGGWLVDFDPQTVLSWLAAFGAGIDFTRQSEYNFQQPQAEQAWSYLREMYDDGCAWIGRLPDEAGYFAQRDAILVSSEIENVLWQEKQLALAENGDEWILLPYPGQNETPALVLSPKLYLILKSQTERQLAAWLFVRWMNQPENQQALVEASGTLPGRLSVVQTTMAFGEQHPQWGSTVQAMPFLHIATRDASWKVARFVLSDAFRQVFASDSTLETIPLILENLDATLEEVSEESP